MDAEFECGGVVTIVPATTYFASILHASMFAVTELSVIRNAAVGTRVAGDAAVSSDPTSWALRALQHLQLLLF